MAKIVDLDSIRMLKKMEKSVDEMDQMFTDALSWPEDLQEKFFEEALAIMEPLVKEIQDLNKEDNEPKQ